MDNRVTYPHICYQPAYSSLLFKDITIMTITCFDLTKNHYIIQNDDHLHGKEKFNIRMKIYNPNKYFITPEVKDSLVN